jgi:hypothetical protein
MIETLHKPSRAGTQRYFVAAGLKPGAVRGVSSYRRKVQISLMCGVKKLFIAIGSTGAAAPIALRAAQYHPRSSGGCCSS